MATKVVKTVFQFRRATTAEWNASPNVIPAAGEPCFDLDLHTLKIGDGKSFYKDLPAIGGVELKVEADGKSVVVENNVFKLLGFDAAAVGAQPRKNDKGELEWFIPSTNVEELKTTVATLQSEMKTVQDNITIIKEIVTPSGDGAVSLLSRITTLEGKMDGTGEGSVDAKIDAKLNDLTDDGKINTLKELIGYVDSHGKEAANMAADITSLKGLVGTTSVAEQIAAAGHMTKEEAADTLLSKAEAAASLKHTKYEVSHKPAGVLVDYRDKEIRIMCPADTEWTLQNPGTNGDPSSYYLGFKAYAPEGAVSFKEDMGETISDNTMYYFENNDFAGIDQFGRKYSIMWLAAAQYDAASNKWYYHGEASSVSRYIGWTYSVEWYDAYGRKIGADTIRINLSNETCHTNIEPYYMTNFVKEVSLGGELLDVVNGRVNIPVGAGLKLSDEFVVAEDGTLSLGAISFDKIVQTEDETVVMDGGSAAG